MESPKGRGPWARSLRLAADLVLPRRCASCGAILHGGASPLCGACAAALEWIAEPRCPACGKTLISELGVCMRCRDRSWSFDAAYPVFAFRGVAAALISAYKFGGARSLAGFFADLVAETARSRHPGAAIVPVPYRRAKIVEKGWDQVEELARRLEARGLAVARVLERLPSGEQKKLDLEGRFANARHAYRLRPGAEAPREAILLDDVFTTGATAEACCSALREGGASRVTFVSLAAD